MSRIAVGELELVLEGVGRPRDSRSRHACVVEVACGPGNVIGFYSESGMPMHFESDKRGI